MVIERIKPLLTRALSNLVTLSGLMPSSGVTALWSQKSYVMSFSHKVSLILIISHYSLHFFLFLVHSRPWSWVPILGCTINKGNEVIESYKFDPQLSYVFNRKVITLFFQNTEFLCDDTSCSSHCGSSSVSSLPNLDSWHPSKSRGLAGITKRVTVWLDSLTIVCWNITSKFRWQLENIAEKRFPLSEASVICFHY